MLKKGWSEQPLIDRYNDIKSNEMINRGFIKGNNDTKIENVKKSENGYGIKIMKVYQ